MICVRSIEKKLAGVAGVTSAKVDLDSGKAKVAFDDARLQPAQIFAAVDQIGFHAT